MTDWIERLCAEEYGPTVSAGAAARQMCRSLPKDSRVKDLLETMLSEANRASFDRSQILSDFKKADPQAAQDALMKSFYRINKEHQ